MASDHKTRDNSIVMMSRAATSAPVVKLGGNIKNNTNTNKNQEEEGYVSMQDLFRFHSYTTDMTQNYLATVPADSDTHMVVPVGLILMTGSWSSCRASHHRSTVLENLTRLFESTQSQSQHNTPHDNVRIIPCVGCVCVDESDEALRLCLGDDDDDDDDINSPMRTIHANGANVEDVPSQLPALAIVTGGDILRPTADSNVTTESNTVSSCPGQITFVKNIPSSLLTSVLLLQKDHNSSSSFTQKEMEYERLVRLALEETMNATVSKLVTSFFTPPDIPSRSPVVPMMTTRTNNNTPVRIFVSGDRSQVGKSTVCLGLLGSLLLQLGYKPQELAYIKPATQCEQPQLVEQFCKAHGIPCVPIGPIVYYKGFTRAFLAGETPTSCQLLAQAGHAVDQLSSHKKVMIVDGVGYPSVGSICGTDNCRVSQACGIPIPQNEPQSQQDGNGECDRIPMPVLMVGKSGVGDAVDSFNINATYFEASGTPVLGAVFNRLPLDGYYSLDNCKTAVTAYFEQYKQNPHQQAFGFIPEVMTVPVPDVDTNNSATIATSFASTTNPMDRANELIQIFHQHVDVAKIVEAARSVTESKRLELERASHVNNTAPSSHATTRSKSHVDDSSTPARKRIRLLHETTPHPTTAVSMVREDERMTTSMSEAAATTTYKTRDDIERDANSAGAMLVST